jgi:monoterpene epsilon-lactone hydrolase
MSQELPEPVIVPERRLTPPSTISPEAQAFLAHGLEVPGLPQPEGTADRAAWKAYIQANDTWMTAMLSAGAERFPCELITHRLPHTQVYEIVPEQLKTAVDDSVMLYVHGGAYIAGGGKAAAYSSVPLTHRTGVRTLAVDYRMPPDHPFPAGLEDAVDAYRLLLDRFDPDRIVVTGVSAGAGLAAALVLRIRDLGLPLPSACVLHSPEADLTESGDSFETLMGVDPVLRARLTDTIALYADGHDLRDPYLSPLFGDFGKGFPPTLLTAGTRDLFLSNTVLMHRALRRAKVESQLELWEAMPHGGFFASPEDQEVLAVQAEFITSQLARSRP